VLLVVSRLGLRGLEELCDETVASSNGRYFFVELIVDVLEVLAECGEMSSCCVGLVVAAQALEGGRSSVCG
jgi:hypothetical protein